MEAAEVVFRSKKRKYCRNDEEMEPVLVGQEQVDRQDQQQLGPVTDGQGKKEKGARPGNQRRQEMVGEKEKWHDAHNRPETIRRCVISAFERYEFVEPRWMVFQS